MSAAAGMSFISLALNDAGYGAMWRTGPVAYHPSLHDGLGLLPGESIVGFLYTGTVASEKPSVPPRPDTKEYVSRWAAPGRTSPPCKSEPRSAASPPGGETRCRPRCV